MLIEVVDACVRPHPDRRAWNLPMRYHFENDRQNKAPDDAFQSHQTVRGMFHSPRFIVEWPVAISVDAHIWGDLAPPRVPQDPGESSDPWLLHPKGQARADASLRRRCSR